MATIGAILIAALVGCYMAVGLRARRYTFGARALLIGVTALASIAFYMLS